MNGCQESLTLEGAPTVSPITLIEKKCTKCLMTKLLKEFPLTPKMRDGRKSWCRACCNLKDREFTSKNKELVRERRRKWKEDHPDAYKKMCQNDRERHADGYRERRRRWGERNAKRMHDLRINWEKNNPEKLKASRKKRRDRYRGTLKGMLNTKFSTHMRMSLKGNKAGRKWESLVDYVLMDLKVHLEKQFQPGMSWDNYGEWHIDHKTPIVAFNFETPEDIDFKKAWALKNLQPLWAVENMKKHNKLERPFQPSLSGV